MPEEEVMTDLLKIARAVTGELRKYNAELLYFPEFSLRDLDAMRIVVVPAGIEYRDSCRGTHEELLKVQIGILKRCGEDGLDAMLQFAEELGRGFFHSVAAGAVCTAVSFNPLYSPDHLRERGQFTSVIELTFKGFATGALEKYKMLSVRASSGR